MHKDNIARFERALADLNGENAAMHNDKIRMKQAMQKHEQIVAALLAENEKMKDKFEQLTKEHLLTKVIF